jgi:hypothetical protein
MVQEEWLAFYSSNTKYSSQPMVCTIKEFLSLVEKLLLIGNVLTELAMYNINTRSNILMKCSKAKIKNKLQDGVWHRYCGKKAK